MISEDTALPQPTRRKRIAFGWAIGVLSMLLVGIFVVLLFSRRPEITVVHPAMNDVLQTLTVTGAVRGAQESALTPETAGLLIALLVEEGDQVNIGQVLARVSATVLNAEQEQAVATLRSAEALLTQALADTRVVDAQRFQARAEVNGAEREAAARLNQAKARLRELQAGGTRENRAEAAAAVREAEARVAQATRELAHATTLAGADATAAFAVAQARAAQQGAEADVARFNILLVNAERELKRTEELFAQGAIAQVRVDSAKMFMETAREDARSAVARKVRADVEVIRQVQLLSTTREADVERARTELTMAGEALQAAKARLQTVESPARTELIEQQQSAINAAEAAVVTARKAGNARISTLDRTPTKEREVVAQRRVIEAQRALDTVLVRMRTTEIRAPYAGIITEVLARPGMTVGPSQPLLRLAEMRTPEIVIDVDERDITQVAVGQVATLLAEVNPKIPVKARVTRIGVRADTQRGVVPIILRPTETATWLRSGMTVDATIVLAEETRRMVVPTSAVRRQGDAATVMVVINGRVTSRQVTLGAGAAGNTVVLTGLSIDDLVVVEPAETRIGAKVKPVQQNNDTTAKEQ